MTAVTGLQSDTVLLAFPEYREAAAAIAGRAGIPWAEVAIHRFPDGESRLRLPARLPSQVVFCRSLDNPNEKLIELLLAAAGARQQGVAGCTLVAPYLCYMRQDKAFTQGEVVSQQAVGRLLADYFSAVITVDAHLHRVTRLSDAIPCKHAVNLKATVPMADFVASRLHRPLLVGPDEESQQWVAAIAAARRLDHVVASKQRFGDRDVRISLPSCDYHGRDVVLLDDIASSGATLEVAASEIARHGPASVSVLVTHALFTGDAPERLRAAGVGDIWSCDSVPHATNAVALDGLLGTALAELLGSGREMHAL
jgi:ribose-phosphate pyrophosphokinase